MTNIYTDNSVVIANMQKTIDEQNALIDKMREALKMPNEDVLLDLYKIHAYIPYDADNNPLTPYGNFAQGFGVAFSMFEAIRARN
ncbi:MAG: hypothetical protein CTY27_03260 [Methylotenera sp.]|nr:MAG: hypothetical protein CTY27_03260 [Methylotenera sp.]